MDCGMSLEMVQCLIERKGSSATWDYDFLALETFPLRVIGKTKRCIHY